MLSNEVRIAFCSSLSSLSSGIGVILEPILFLRIEDGFKVDEKGVEADVEGVYPPLDGWYFPGVELGTEHEMELVEDMEALEGLETSKKLM